MIHFSCDLCGKDMQANDPGHHVLKMEIRPAKSGWELSEDDMDSDNLEKVSQLLQAGEHEDADPFVDDAPVSIRFDLCPECRERFLKNPFNCRATTSLDFSKN